MRTKICLVLSLLSLAGAIDAADIDGRVQGELLRRPYVSTVTGEEREYFLYLPKGYETETGTLWPVILFFGWKLGQPQLTWCSTVTC